MAPQSGSAPTALTSNAFTRVGEIFVAWNTAADGSGVTYADTATYPFNASVTLYAQWADISSKVVTFNANGVSGSMAPQVSTQPANLTPNAFSRSGYTFASWNTAADGTGITFVNRSLFPFSSNATLYAQWSITTPVLTGLSATQTSAGQVAVSWKPLTGGGAKYKVTLYSDSDVLTGSCSTSGKSCTITRVPAGGYTVAATATVKGNTGRPALTSVTVISTKPNLTRAWRGSGKDAKLVYATVAVPQGADPSRVLVWTLIPRDGKPTWVSRPVVRDTWTCSYMSRQSLCTWSRQAPTSIKVKFSVNGLWSKVAAYRSPKQA